MVVFARQLTAGEYTVISSSEADRRFYKPSEGFSLPLAQLQSLQHIRVEFPSDSYIPNQFPDLPKKYHIRRFLIYKTNLIFMAIKSLTGTISGSQ